MYLIVMMKITCEGRAFAKVTRVTMLMVDCCFGGMGLVTQTTSGMSVSPRLIQLHK
jgi:hypothetical protein